MFLACSYKSTEPSPFSSSILVNNTPFLTVHNPEVTTGQNYFLKMTLLCFCTPPPWVRARSRTARDQPDPSSPPPLARPPGPLTLNPVTPPVSTAVPVETPSPRETSIHSAVLVPVEPDELDDLVVEDSDTDDDLESGLRKKGAGPLGLVKSRIRRHLSQDSLGRRKSRISVGTSQQEIERRAELKRLMHKRIQEELHDEEVLAALQSDTSSSYRYPDSPSIDYSPVGGPRDTIEFSVMKRVSSHVSHISSNAQPVPSLDIGPQTAEFPTSVSNTQSRPESQAQQSDPLIRIPSSPALLPRHKPSSSLGSWRLSFSADQLHELIFSTEHEHIVRDPVAIRQRTPSPVRASSPLAPPLRRAHSLPRSHSSPASSRSQAIEQSPLRTWLRSQGLGSRPPSSANREANQQPEHEAAVQEAEIVYLRKWNSVQNAALPEIDTRRSGIIHLYDMDIHHQLATQTVNSPAESPWQSEFQRNERGRSSASHQSHDYTLTPQNDSFPGRPVGAAQTTTERNDTANAPVSASGGASVYSATDIFETYTPPPFTTPREKMHVNTAEKSIDYFEPENSGPSLLVEKFHHNIGNPHVSDSSKPSFLHWLQLTFPTRVKSVTRGGTEASRQPVQQLQKGELAEHEHAKEVEGKDPSQHLTHNDASLGGLNSRVVSDN